MTMSSAEKAQLAVAIAQALRELYELVRKRRRDKKKSRRRRRRLRKKEVRNRSQRVVR